MKFMIIVKARDWRRKMRFSAPVLLAATLLVLGCNEKDTAPTPKPVGSVVPVPASASSSPTPATGGCPADYTKNEAGGFCFKLTAGFKQLPEQQMGSMTVYPYQDETSGVSFRVTKFEDGDFKSRVDQMKRTTEVGKIVEKGDLSRDGKFWIYDDAEGNRWSVSLTHGAMTIDCSTRVWAAATFDNKQAVLDQCKTVTPL